MTDLLIGIAGNSFVCPGKNPSNGDAVVYRNGNTNGYRNSEMRHSRSEDLLGAGRPLSPMLAAASEDDLVATTALHECASPPPTPCYRPSRTPGPPGVLADRVDPEDSIRDIVTENDLYRFVLFKRHYDKYVALAARYEEARGVAYYLEERYHEVKAEKDKLEERRMALEKRLEGCESELREKEEELFLQLERSLRLEDEVERIRTDRDACVAARDRLERERAAALRQLQLQASQGEATRRTLERARQDVVKQATVIRAERDALELENEILKERLRAEQGELGAERRRREEGVAALSHEAATLRHAARHLRAAALHATACRRRRRCSVCVYAKRTFGDVEDFRDDGKLFRCLQAPLQDLRTWLRPSASTALPPLRTSSPMDRGISFIDDSSSISEDEAYPSTPVADVSLSSNNSSAPATARAFSSDSGFSSETGDRRSRSYEGGNNSRKISESSSSEPDATRNGGGFTRSRWTASFRKLLGRKSKAKATAEQSS
ncbi:uncharacterized protein LOC105691974 [Athalia rosae]|uniref:uncharacterized protein LOC105691974 n=1 Tax=Athalia rosae TaxID=37344 RepID=UPI0020340A3C|nr:uncharacterized protein LOC105691974 [Athalia rosae]XP_048508317.1 uncharacterized protein LOC105691974 [Athalia rosae]XP_048508318.1 uncharacterized protein LOC105691974 [Athalia rosae]